MASRALAKAARSPDDYAKVYGRILAQREGAGDHPLARRHVRPGAGRLLGARRSRPGHGGRRRRHHRQRRQGRRRQDLAARQGQGDRHAPPAAAGRAHVYRRRLQLRRADRGRRARLFRCAARYFRRHRAGRCGGAWRAQPRRTGDVPRYSAPDGRRSRATSSARRPASTRPASCSWPISTACRIISSWWAARKARARPCISPSSFASPTRRACLCDPEDDAAAAHARGAGRTRGDGTRCAISPTTYGGLRSTPPPSSPGRCSSRSKVARGPASRGIAPWRDGVAALGPKRSRELLRAHDMTVDLLLPRRHVHGGRGGRPAKPRSRTTSARSTRRRRSARAAWCWWPAGCRPAPRTSPARAAQVRDGIAAMLPHARAARMPLAIEPLHPMTAADRCVVSTLDQALDLCDDLGDGVGRRGRRLSRVVGSGAQRRRSRAPARASSPITSATGWFRPPTCWPTAA